VKGELALVTGGAGFIGSHLVRALAAQGARVRILDNFSSGSRTNLSGVERSVEVLEGDIRNAIACRNACRGVQYVFHLAAYISVPGSIQDPVTADAVNIGGTLNLLMAARDCRVRRFVFSSSAAVYGETGTMPVPETALPRPLSPYGVEKLYGEHMARLYYTLHGLETVCLRYFNVYGPGQNPASEYAAVIPRFLSMMLQGQTPTIFGDGEQTRDFLFVEDVAGANLRAAQAQGVAGEVFNVASGVSTSLNTLYDTLRRATGLRREALHGPERPGDIRHSCADTTRTRETLGFAPQFDLAAGLERTIAYYRERLGDHENPDRR
jgi:nucleoside-diphosphate-sugar epimerase